MLTKIKIGEKINTEELLSSMDGYIIIIARSSIVIC